MKNQDFKNFRANPPIDWEFVTLILIFLFIVIALAVEWPKEGLELAAQMHPVTDCDGPVMSMPIDIERVRT
jgi:hypothetical protein